MKTSLISLSLLAVTGTAFSPIGRPSRKVATALHAQTQSRQKFFSQSVALIAGFGLLVPKGAVAAKYGGFGAGSPEVLDPSEADVVSEVMESGAVQGALKKIKAYQTTVRDMTKSLDTDPQKDLKSTIKQFDFAKLRDDLNTLNTAFEEDTQRGTDRLIRNIMQDITELESANKLKQGVERSDRRLALMKGKLEKLDQAFDDYLAFAK